MLMLSINLTIIFSINWLIMKLIKWSKKLGVQDKYRIDKLLAQH